MLQKFSSGSVIEGTKVSYLLDFDNDVVSFSSEEERDNFLEAYENVTSIEKPKQMIKQKKEVVVFLFQLVKVESYCRRKKFVVK